MKIKITNTKYVIELTRFVDEALDILAMVEKKEVKSNKRPDCQSGLSVIT
jgi:hypothetical protein